ncbi:MAG: DUF1549 domain-containing protein, partial [Planctomycetaceae bacterium]
MHMQRHWFFTVAGILLLGSSAQGDEAQVRREQFFEERVRPLLFNRCFECHGDKKQESGLRLDSRSAILRGGDSGPAAVARRVDDSLLIQAVRGEAASMPPEDPLEEAEIEVLERWVAMGLPWTAGDAPPEPSLGDQRAIQEIADSHWAFQPINKPPLPAAVSAGTPSEVDVFLNQQIDEAGLQVAPPADRRTLLRRLTFDLIGLPPTPEEVTAFESDRDPDAIAKVVERLLQSPHYGERWGRHWLDVARYADSQDWQAQTDVRYPFAYTYRDWVIRSLNADMPYDEFIRKQLAADFIETQPDSPELAALGFLTVGPRFRNNRLELAADQIDVVTRGLMGLTVACARCHDHKYDPVPIEDYYALYGVFASCTIPDDYVGVSMSVNSIRLNYNAGGGVSISANLGNASVWDQHGGSQGFSSALPSVEGSQTIIVHTWDVTNFTWVLTVTCELKAPAKLAWQAAILAALEKAREKKVADYQKFLDEKAAFV